MEVARGVRFASANLALCEGFRTFFVIKSIVIDVICTKQEYKRAISAILAL